MMSMPSQRRWILRTIALALLCTCSTIGNSQTGSIDEQDPVKLFERGQDAHAKSDYQKAIEFYDAAIRLKPDAPV